LNTAGPVGSANVEELGRFLQMQLKQGHCMEVGMEQGEFVGKG